MAYFEIFRGTQAEVNAQPIIDGQILYTTDLGVDDKIYKDVGSTRTILSNDNGILQSETPTATNLGAITAHTVMVKSGIGRYKLAAVPSVGGWSKDTTYAIATISAQFRPSIVFRKDITIRSTSVIVYHAGLEIGTNGLVKLYIRDAIGEITFYIDETYII